MDFTIFLCVVVGFLFIDAQVSKIINYKIRKNTKTYTEEHYPDRKK